MKYLVSIRTGGLTSFLSRVFISDISLIAEVVLTV